MRDYNETTGPLFPFLTSSSTLICLVSYSVFIALHLCRLHLCRVVLYTSEMSVCPSVRLSVKRVNCEKNGRNLC